MLEFTGIGSVLRGIGVLYWLIAIGALALAIWKGKNWRHKTLWAAVAVAAFGFLPAKEIVEQAKPPMPFVSSHSLRAACSKLEKSLSGRTESLMRQCVAQQ